MFNSVVGYGFSYFTRLDETPHLVHSPLRYTIFEFRINSMIVQWKRVNGKDFGFHQPDLVKIAEKIEMSKLYNPTDIKTVGQD